VDRVVLKALEKERERCVRQAIELNKSYQQMALDDEDLELLWEELGRD
jgi:hypothetical protein